MDDGLVIALCGDVLPVQPLDRAPPSAQRVFSAIAQSDYALGNFEMPVTDRGTPLQKLLNVRAPAHVGPSLGRLGLKTVTLANNHAPDYGWTGLCDTREALQAHGIQTVGMGHDHETAASPLITRVKGTRIGVVAYSCLTPTGAGAGPGRPGISALHVNTAYEVDPWYQMEEPGDPACIRIRTHVREEELRRARACVARARTQCDLLIATVHWGFGSTETLAEYQRPLAEALIDAGADVVHGHHPHAIQAMGFHRGKPIIFSANVLVGQQVFLEASPTVQALWRAMSSDGYLTFIRWRDGAIQDVEIVPTVLAQDRLPVFAQGKDADRIFERLARLSGTHGASIQRTTGPRIAASARPCGRAGPPPVAA